MGKTVSNSAAFYRFYVLIVGRPGNPNVHLRFTSSRNRFPVSPNGEWMPTGALAPRR